MSDYQARGQGGWPAQPPASGGGYGQPDYGYGPGPATPPRRRRKRWPIVLLVLVILIAAILAIADQVAKSVAENRIAQQIQSSGLNTKPSVNIEGWPFLTQVAAHDIKAIDISANNVTTTGGKLPVNFTAKATGVHPNSSFNGATVDHITGQATITYRALDNYLGAAIGIPGLNAISFSPDPAKGPNAVKADAGIGSVDATVTKTGPTEITIKFGSLSGIASLLGGAGSIPPQIIDIPKLPAGLVVGSPEVTSQGVVIPASASNTTLSQ
jgi:LmeA-like phospholipid-binding